MSLEKLFIPPKQKPPVAVTVVPPPPMAYWTSNWVCQKRWAAWGDVTNPEQLFAAGYSACFWAR